MSMREERVCHPTARRRPVLLAAWLCLSAFAASQAGAAPGAAPREAAQQSRFLRTVLAVQDAAPEVRSDFAATALSHLAGAYSTETRLARRNDQDAGSRAWSATVDQYASQMRLLLDDVELGLPVRLTIEADDSLAIAVGDRTVIINHPRLSQQGALEQDILQDFCSRQECGQISPDPGQLEPIPTSGTYIKPHWNFTERGSDCSFQGITVRFRSDQGTANARVICEQFLQELVTLADALAVQWRYAVDIQWEQLELQAAPGRPEHTVRLNALGDSVTVTAPLLHATPGLLRQVLPWLRQRLENTPAAPVEIDAAGYGWQQPPGRTETH